MNRRVQLLKLLFSELDCAIVGSTFKNAQAEKDECGMIRAAAEYFRRRPANSYLASMWSDDDLCIDTADRAVNGDVTVINIPWHFADGNIDWHFNPTLSAKPVNHEWLWQLGRMYFWKDMAIAYRCTGKSVYAEKFNSQLRSWIDSCPPSDAGNSSGLNTWRTIECGIRLMSFWTAAFEIFRKAPEFTDENLCLMLASMLEQSIFLRKHHRRSSNWLLMEMAGVYTVTAQFPEFISAVKLRKYAVKKFGTAFCAQMLPDGMHDELSPDYHFVSINCAEKFLLQAKDDPSRMQELPASFVAAIENAYQASIELATPGLTSPRTNDCYTFHLSRILKNALKIFPERTDFLWAYSNRQQGKMPVDKVTASRFLPYAGFIAMRSSWDEDALYCCFDTGPIGNGHQHWDKLNLNIYKGSEELLFDDGGGQYEQSVYRWYGRSAADHNTVLVDNMVQMRYAPKVLKRPAKAEWITNKIFDYAKAVYDDTFAVWKYDKNEKDIPLFKPAVHTREVRFCKPEFFCVVDKLRSCDGEAHNYELRFQLNTLNVKKIRKYPGALLAGYDKEYDLLIVPLFPDSVSIKIASGKLGRLPAGWFIGRNDLLREPASTVMMRSEKVKNFRFATLLIPVRKGEALPGITRISKDTLSVNINGRTFELDLKALKH